MVRAVGWQWHQLLGGHTFAVAYFCASEKPPWSHMLMSCTILLPLQPHHTEKKEQPQPVRQTVAGAYLRRKVTPES